MARARLRGRGAASFGLLGVIVVACSVGPGLLHATTGWGYTDIPADIAAMESFAPFRYVDGTFSAQHPLGTDNLGRDLLARVLAGGRVSLGVAFLSCLISLVIALVYGSTAGYSGGWIDSVMVRALEGFSAIPYLLLCIAALGLFRSKTQFGQLAILIIVLSSVSWLTLARIVRDLVRSAMATEYVLAARALGCSDFSILLRHVLPNTAGIIISYTCLTVPVIILTESFLSFLGLGVQPPLTSWGALIGEGVRNIAVFPWQLIAPAVVMVLTAVSVSFVGETLRATLDPLSARPRQSKYSPENY